MSKPTNAFFRFLIAQARAPALDPFASAPRMRVGKESTDLFLGKIIHPSGNLVGGRHQIPRAEWLVTRRERLGGVWVSELVLHVSRTVPSQVVSVETKTHESCRFDSTALLRQAGADWRNRCPLTRDVKSARQSRRGARRGCHQRKLFSLFWEKTAFFGDLLQEKKALRP